MRVRFTFSFNGLLKLPVHYNHLVQAFIYANIQDKTIQVKYHEKGHDLGGKLIKLFTYSRIFGRFEIDQSQKSISFMTPISLTISAFDQEFLSEFTNNVLRSDLLYLNGVKLKVETFEPIPYQNIKENVQIEMLSPVTVYVTEEKDGKRHTRYFSPWEQEFNDLITENIRRKMGATSDDSENSCYELKLTPMFEKNDKFQKIIRFKDTIIKAWAGTYLLSGQSELIRMAYFSGLGVKNSEGFGCFRIFGTGE
jgi:CRISPR-associated endoribonuclease Cas6